MNNQEAIKADHPLRERTSPIVPRHESLTIRSSQLPEANESVSKNEFAIRLLRTLTARRIVTYGSFYEPMPFR
ncbi:hypothetical protein CEXT_672031 [Caerostris extrusa]|uniref:Uncharacterized protein n=1 Tax=Caerostris extrusa TaxID=172846 RepID=A0AAV4RJG8_CAEEX|nr:hypothetical protein CEXT_672031 [Caerostris extrusa]